MPSTKRIFENIVFLSSERYIRLAGGFFVLFLMARYWGANTLGYFASVTALVSLLTSFANLGLGPVIVRRLVEEPGKSELILGTGLIAILSFSIILFLGLFCFLLYASKWPESIRMVGFIIGITLIFKITDIFKFYFEASVNSRNVALVMIMVFAIALFFKIIFITMGYGLFEIALIMLSESAVLFFLVLLFFYREKTSNCHFLFSITELILMLKTGLPVALSALSVSLYLRIDQLMIMHMLDISSVGVYSVGSRLNEAMAIFPSVIATTLFPLLVNGKSEGFDTVNKLTQQLHDILVLYSLVAVACVWLFAEALIHFVFGSEFFHAAEVLKLLSLGLPFVAMGVASSKWYFINGLEAYLLYRTVSAAMINIILNIILIPEFGLNGACLASVAAIFFSGFLFDLFVPRGQRLVLVKIRSMNIVGSTARIFA